MGALVGEDVAAGLGDEDVVLDADAQFAAGLDRLKRCGLGPLDDLSHGPPIKRTMPATTDETTQTNHQSESLNIQNKRANVSEMGLSNVADPRIIMLSEDLSFHHDL